MYLIYLKFTILLHSEQHETSNKDGRKKNRDRSRWGWESGK